MLRLKKLESLLTRSNNASILDGLLWPVYKIYPCGEKYAKGSDPDHDAYVIRIECIKCKNTFKARISYANLHVYVWECTYCGTRSIP